MNTASVQNDNTKVLEVRNARIVYTGTHRNKDVVAVEDVSLEIDRGRSLGIVGASGCGKSSLVRGIMHPVSLASGSVHVLGEEPARMSLEARRRMRRHFQMVFQDPLACLNPAMTVVDAIADPLLIHGLASPAMAREQARQLLERVGLAPAEDNTQGLVAFEAIPRPDGRAAGGHGHGQHSAQPKARKRGSGAARPAGASTEKDMEKSMAKLRKQQRNMRR